MPRAKKLGASKNTLRLYDRLWKLAEKLGSGSKTAGIEGVLAHFESASETGVCPICKLPFDQCEYFKRLDEE